MKQYCVSYQERETMPDRLEAFASKQGLTPEQLIKRFIAEGMAGANPSNEPAEPGMSLEDFLVKMGFGSTSSCWRLEFTCYVSAVIAIRNNAGSIKLNKKPKKLNLILQNPFNLLKTYSILP